MQIKILETYPYGYFHFFQLNIICYSKAIRFLKVNRYTSCLKLTQKFFLVSFLCFYGYCRQDNKCELQKQNMKLQSNQILHNR